MTKKFFSLIFGDSVHAGPKGKVIPSEEFSTLLEAKEVLLHVQKDAEQYREQVTSECEILKEQAQKDGFEAGFSEWAEHIAELENEIKKVRTDLEKLVVPVALKAARKILGKELELSETAIVDIVSTALKAVAQHKRITIWVNAKNKAILEKNRDNIKVLFENLESLSIRERDDVASGGCIIETEAGIINAQLENQWMILEGAFQKLMREEKKQKP